MTFLEMCPYWDKAAREKRVDKMKFPVAKLRKSTIKKILERQSNAEIVYNKHTGRMFLMSDISKIILPGYWWCLDFGRLEGMTSKTLSDVRNNPNRADDSKPYLDEKYVICEIQMIDGRCKNHVDKKVWERLKKI